MKNKTKNANWIPEILYEENSQIPFIEVPDGVDDPERLFIFLSKKTGESEIGPSGEELPIVDLDLHQFVDMQILKDRLTVEEYDKVRSVLGLESVKSATKKGQEITKSVSKNMNDFSQKVDEAKKKSH
jgi:hypothetical protein